MLKLVMVMYLKLVVVMVVEMVQTRVGVTNPPVDLAMSATALAHTLSNVSCLMVGTISLKIRFCFSHGGFLTGSVTAGMVGISI